MKVLYPAKINSPDTTLAASIGVDVFVNGGFERGDLYGWSASGDVSVVDDKSDMIGEYCVKLVANTTPSFIIQSPNLTGVSNIEFRYYVDCSSYCEFRLFHGTTELMLHNWDTGNEWKTESIDVSSYEGETELKFNIVTSNESVYATLYLDDITQNFFVPGGEMDDENLSPWTTFATGGLLSSVERIWAFWPGAPDYTYAVDIWATWVDDPGLSYIEQSLDFTGMKTLWFRKCVDSISGTDSEFYVTIGGTSVYSNTEEDGDCQVEENWPDPIQIDVSSYTGTKTLRFACRADGEQYDDARVSIDQVKLIPALSDFNNIKVTELDVFPDAPNLAVIGSSGDALETIKYRGKSATSGEGYLTDCVRGFQSDAKEWTAGASIARNVTTYDIDSTSENITEKLTLEGTAGATISEYDVCYINPDGKWYPADATVETKTMGELGVALSSASADSNILLQIAGIIQNDSWSLTPSSRIYIGNTAGSISSIAGTYERLIGIAVSSDSINLAPYEREPTMIAIHILNELWNVTRHGVELNFSAIVQSKYAIVSYDWDFGDETTHSTSDAPHHVYAATGDYTVTLTATDSASNEHKAYYTIHITDAGYLYHQGLSITDNPTVNTSVSMDKINTIGENLGESDPNIVSISSVSVQVTN